MSPTILFDFDGTLALGDGPIRAFARAISERIGEVDLIERTDTALAAFASGTSEDRDGYDAVTRVARAAGIEQEVITASYDSSRALLGSHEAAVDAPPGLATFLSTVGADARLILATNAPGDGVTAVLTSWGVLDAFDAMHFTVGKPAGLDPILRDALVTGPVLAVGDIAEFDLAPASALGAATALVGATSERSIFPATMRGSTLADLYEPISAWARTATNSPTPSSVS